MFYLVTHYLGFLKHVPGLPLVFDALLKIWTALFSPGILDAVDDVNTEVSGWDNITVTTHKYGGMQFNLDGIELGHIHSNGLVDLLLNRKLRHQLMQANDCVQHHHQFKNSGWVSYSIQCTADKAFVIDLFRHAYQLRAQKMQTTLRETETINIIIQTST